MKARMKMSKKIAARADNIPFGSVIEIMLIPQCAAIITNHLNKVSATLVTPL